MTQQEASAAIDAPRAGRPLGIDATTILGEVERGYEPLPTVRQRRRAARDHMGPFEPASHRAMLGDMFAAWNLVSPVVAVLMLIEATVAAWRGDYLTLGLGMRVLGNEATLAIPATTDYYRYGVPLEDLRVIIAI